jgi:pentatricopeptide repeat protein
MSAFHFFLLSLDLIVLKFKLENPPSAPTVTCLMKILRSHEVPEDKLLSLCPQLLEAIVVHYEHRERVQAPKLSENKLDLSFQNTQMLGYVNMLVILVESLCRRGLLEKAESILLQLHHVGIPITADAGLPIIRAYALNGYYVQSIKLFEWLVGLKVMPFPGSYHDICESLRKAGKIEELAQFMVKYGSI